MKRIKIIPIVLIVMTIVQVSVRAQSYTSLGMEGGSGFIYTKLANTNAKGFFGLTIYGIYSSVSLPQSRESLISAVSAFTYSATDNLEFAMVFYTVGRGVIADESISDTRIKSGLGESQFALKYRLPLGLASADLVGHVAFHVPMGINFASHPSYPYDTDVYSLEVLALQSLRLTRSFQIHLNEGYRWRGLRPDYVEEVDLILITLGGSWRWHPKWLGFISVASNIEADNNVQPFRDRMVLTQGIQYGIGYGFILNLAGSIRLNKERSDPLKNRAKNWRIFFGFSFGLGSSK